MGKDKKGLNPADQFRREQKKHDAKKNKISKQKVQEVRDLLNHPSKLEEKIKQLQKESDENRLDKSLKDQIKQYKEMYDIALKKQKLSGAGGYHDQDSLDTDLANQSTSSSSVKASSGLIPASVDFTTIKRRPDESVFYHPVYNPLGVPPPGQAQIYRPLPPPRVTSSGPIPMGGINGIPLPPPPPPRMLPIGMPPTAPSPLGAIPPPPPPAMPVQSPFENFPAAITPPSALAINQIGQMNVAKDNRKAPSTTIDPLDPSSRSYLRRYNDDKISLSRQPVQMPLPSPEPPKVSSPEETKQEDTAAISLDEPIVFNIEVIMRRRFEVPVDVADVDEDEENDEGDETVGPHYQQYDVEAALPSAEELLRQQGIFIEEDEFSGGTNQQTAKPASLAILGDYGDSDDEGSISNEEESHDGQTSPNYKFTAILPTHPSATTAPTVVEPSTQLKTIKANANLTKFVPSALLVKRSSAGTSSQPVKVFKSEPPPTGSEVANATSEPVGEISTAKRVSSVDEAYLEFLNEIEALDASNA